VPVDAEEWLARRGVRREPLRPLEEPAPAVTDGGAIVASPASPAPSVREVIDLARQVAQEPVSSAPADRDGRDALRPSPEASGDSGADAVDAVGTADTVEAAFVFLVRSTTNAPQSEGRLTGKLLDRGLSPEVIDAALVRARTAGVVDDAALLTALIAERRARGHADVRLRRDLRDRGFTGEQVDAALANAPQGDPAAAAFALARSQAERQRDVDAETAVRRIVGHLVRRGHGDGLARKAARDAVYADREAQQVAER
jgi:regulatory protein